MKQKFPLAKVLPQRFLAVAIALIIVTPTTATLSNAQVTYNVQTNPDFKYNPNLQLIVNEVVGIAKSKRMPTHKLSITLIDLQNNSIASYQPDTPRYPASVIKMFWMVIAYEYINAGILNEQSLNKHLYKMIDFSDNNAASYLVDQISKAKSGSYLRGQTYQAWKNKRQQINNFFLLSGYNKLNINQKLYPISQLKLARPQGRELQLRRNPQNSRQEIRNQVTTNHAARLLYEIATKQAVSEAYSKKMLQLLTRDLSPVGRRRYRNSFNPIAGFFGQSLPADIFFASKAGWFSQSRSEAAIVKTKDNKAYILVVFGDDRAYAANKRIFPVISSLVYQRMKNL